MFLNLKYLSENNILQDILNFTLFMFLKFTRKIKCNKLSSHSHHRKYLPNHT